MATHSTTTGTAGSTDTTGTAPTRVRVGVTGSRSYTDRGAITYFLQRAAEGARHGNPTATTGTCLVHGGAAGVDTTAEVAATAARWATEVHRADWSGMGRGAGMARNRAMVDSGMDAITAHPVLPRPGGGSGTEGCLRYALKCGVPAYINVPIRTGGAALTPDEVEVALRRLAGAAQAWAADVARPDIGPALQAACPPGWGVPVGGAVAGCVAALRLPYRLFAGYAAAGAGVPGGRYAATPCEVWVTPYN